MKASIDAAEVLSYEIRRRNEKSGSVTVTDPARRTRVLAEHIDLSAADARELAAVYTALGYDVEHVVVTPTPARRMASCAERSRL